MGGEGGVTHGTIMVYLMVINESSTILRVNYRINCSNGH